jgi:hypothetical protein
MITPIIAEIKTVQKVRDSGCTANFALLAIDSDDGTHRTVLKNGTRGFAAKSRMKSPVIPAVHSVLDVLP